MKSPLLRAFFTPHVHSRLRKRLSRCTLDCGFKTSESPALRGFVGGPWALATAALYLVLKSNGLHRPKIRLKKFGFSSKSVPANIAKKLPSQRCSQPLFNFAHKWPTSAFTGESGYTLGFANRIAHSGLHGETRGVSDGGGITTLGAFRTFTNIPGPGVRTANFAAFGPWSGVLPKNAESLRDSDALMRVAVPRRRGPAGLRDLFRFCRNCGLYALCSGLSACMGQGWYHYPQCALCAVEIPDGRMSKRFICRFLRSGGRSSPHDSYFLANTQNFLLAVPVANAFALWYDKFSKLESVTLFLSSSYYKSQEPL